jgi:hypothetical protein
MTELARSVAAGALWTLAFVVIALNARRRVSGLTHQGVLVAYPAFFAFQVVLAKALAAAGLLTSAAMLAGYVVAVSAGSVGYYIRRRGAALAPDDPRDPGPDDDADAVLTRRVVLAGAGVIIAGLALFSLISPVAIWDVLAYHMPMVASYIQNGSLDAWPTQDLRQIYRVNAGELQLLNLALLSGSDAWVELPNALALAVCLVATFELARSALRRRSLAWLVVAVVLTAPQIQFGAASAKNDLTFTAVLLGAFFWAIRAAASPSTAVTAYVSLAAVCGGLAAATKVMGLNVLGAVGLLLVILVARRRLPLRAVVTFGAAAVVTLLVLVGDVYWANYVRDAVPVGVAPNEVNFRFGPGNLVAAARFYIYDLTFKRLLITQVFEHDFAHYGYLFPFIAAGAVVTALRQVMRPGVRAVALAGLAVMAAGLFLSVIAVRLPIEWDQRFMIWLVPALAILAASLAERLDERRVLALATGAVSFGLVNFFLIFSNGAEGLFARSATHLAVTGTVARDVDVPSDRWGWMIEGFSVLDRAAASDSVLYVGSDDSWMYPAWGRGFTRHVRGVWNATDAAAQVAARRHRFVVIEAIAPEPIREAATSAAQRNGYVPLFASERRTILERAAPPAAATR